MEQTERKALQSHSPGMSPQLPPLQLELVPVSKPVRPPNPGMQLARCTVRWCSEKACVARLPCRRGCLCCWCTACQQIVQLCQLDSRCIRCVLPKHYNSTCPVLTAQGTLGGQDPNHHSSTLVSALELAELQAAGCCRHLKQNVLGASRRACSLSVWHHAPVASSVQVAVPALRSLRTGFARVSLHYRACTGC